MFSSPWALLSLKITILLLIALLRISVRECTDGKAFIAVKS